MLVMLSLCICISRILGMKIIWKREKKVEWFIVSLISSQKRKIKQDISKTYTALFLILTCGLPHTSSQDEVCTYIIVWWGLLEERGASKMHVYIACKFTSVCQIFLSGLPAPES